MIIEQYEQLCKKLELYNLLEQGFEDKRQGKIRPLSEAISDIRKGIAI